MLIGALAAYILIGLAVCIRVDFTGRKHRKGEFRPLFLLADGSLFSFLLLFLFWPLWIFVQLAERSCGTTPNDPPAPGEPTFVTGVTGCAETDLKPSGLVRVGPRLIEAYSESGLILKGQEVEVLEQNFGGFRVKALQREGQKVSVPS